jgi:hypothetical protein
MLLNEVENWARDGISSVLDPWLEIKAKIPDL